MARIIKGRQMTARYLKGREVLKEYKQGRLVWQKGGIIPNDYTMCDYIYNSSTNRGGVDLGFKFRPLDYSIEAKFKQDVISNGMICAVAGSGQAGSIWMYNYSNSDRFDIDVCYSGGWKFNKTLLRPLTTDLLVFGYVGNPNGCYVTKDGELYGTVQDISEWAAEESTANLFIFARGETTNAYKGRIYYLKVWNTATEEAICNLIPCSRNSDGAAGFWDTAQKQFFTSTYWTAHFDNE